MNITVTKVIRELKNKHGWIEVDPLLVKHTIDIINDELIKHKNLTIKK